MPSSSPASPGAMSVAWLFPGSHGVLVRFVLALASTVLLMVYGPAIVGVPIFFVLTLAVLYILWSAVAEMVESLINNEIDDDRD